MLQRITLLSLSLVVGFSRCTRDAPTAAEPRALAAPDTVDLALARQQVAGLVVALEDARSRILPTLGSGASAQALPADTRDWAASLDVVHGVLVRLVSGG